MYHITIVDGNGRNIGNQYKITPKPTKYGDYSFTIELLDDSSFKEMIVDDEILFLMDLIEEQLKCGNFIPKTRRLLELYDKLGNTIERK